MVSHEGFTRCEWHEYEEEAQFSITLGLRAPRFLAREANEANAGKCFMLDLRLADNISHRVLQERHFQRYTLHSLLVKRLMRQ